MNKQDDAAERLFGEAVELPREQRSAFLDQACAGKPDLRRIVEGLLDSNDQLCGFLSEPAYVPAMARAPLASQFTVLDVGTRLLERYVITGKLGAGGMGLVYQAHDEKLGRQVAIKMLQRGLLPSEDARARFRREAQTLAKLNHPQIAAVYDVIEQDGSDCIVMELVEGESLAFRLRRGPLPVTEATTIALQIAEALVEAHDHGVIHRDLKPANVMLTPRGQAKVLDFGLARLLLGPSDVTQAADTVGVIGTPLYMSPEQALGETADARSDLWSLGITYYELLTGVAPFRRPTTLAILRAITDDAVPPLRDLCPAAPIVAEQMMARALEKDVDLRYQHANDFALDLRRTLRDLDQGRRHERKMPAESASNGILTPAVWPRHRVSLTLAVLLLLTIAGLVGWRFWPTSRPFATVSVDQITNVGNIERIALSTDGRFLAEVKNDKGQRTLWVRNTATNTETQVLGPFAYGYLGLTFSPDGNHLYFTRQSAQSDAANDLSVMPAFGGTPRQVIFNVDSPVSFQPDGNRFVYLRWSPERRDEFSEIHIADKDGSNDHLLFSTSEKALAPVWSADGKKIAWLQTELGTTRIGMKVIDISSRKVTTVAAPPAISWVNPGFAYAALAWMPDSAHLLALYNRRHSDRAQIGIIKVASGEFHSVTNDVNSYSELALSGNGRTLATVLSNVDSNIALYGHNGGAMLSTLPLRVTPSTIAWASEDRLLYIVGGSILGTMDRASGAVQIFDTGEVTPGDFVSACPDGHILFTGFPKDGNEPRLFRMKADGGEITQLTSTGFARSPSCSTDSQRAYFSTGSDVNVALWSIPLAGGAPELLIPPVNYSGAAVSRDGKRAALFALRQGKVCVIVTDLQSKRMQAPLFIDQSLANIFNFSPDSQAIVSDALRNGGITLLRQPLDGSPAHALFESSPDTINDFQWSPSASQLAVARLKTSSDVVLIMDQAGKETP